MYEDSISNGSGFVTRSAIVANSFFPSSPLNGLVDILKPAEGIEPSESGVTNPFPRQAAGYCHCSI